MPKYAPLRQHLETAPHPVTMTFDAIAALIGDLPASAFRQWWANSRGTHVEAAAWLEAGRRVVSVDLTRQLVTFS